MQENSKRYGILQGAEKAVCWRERVKREGKSVFPEEFPTVETIMDGWRLWRW